MSSDSEKALFHFLPMSAKHPYYVILKVIGTVSRYIGFPPMKSAAAMAEAPLHKKDAALGVTANREWGCGH